MNLKLLYRALINKLSTGATISRIRSIKKLVNQRNINLQLVDLCTQIDEWIK